MFSCPPYSKCIKKSLNILGAGDRSRAKELTLEMSCGRKYLRCEKCLIVENIWWWKKLQPRVSQGGKLLAPKDVTSDNISCWQIPHGGKYLMVQKLQPLSEDYLDSNKSCSQECLGGKLLGPITHCLEMIYYVT